MTSTAVHVEVHLGPDDLANALRADVLAGLTANPKELLPKYFYDERGSRLFDEITRLPEYYPTRREREILQTNAAEIASLSGADTVVELGSGTSEKTRILLDAFRDAGALRRFVPFDVSEVMLREAGAAIASEYPGVEVRAVVGDFERHLGAIPRVGRRLVALLGGTIGNLQPEVRAKFLAAVAESMQSGDTFLLGTDLVKDVGRLEAAYNDRAGVTAEFNKNVLAVINRELDAEFDVDRFEHVARFDTEAEWIEMLLRSTADQTVRIGGLGIDVRFADGELMRTEVSAKFRPERVQTELAAAGLLPEAIWMDSQGDFALSLARRA